MRPAPEIIPAILTDNPVTLHAQLAALAGQTSWVHIDILDNTLVPGKTVPINQLTRTSKAVSLEIHLMVSNPEQSFEQCAIIGAKRVIVHAAAVSDITSTKTLAANYGLELVVAFDPDQNIEAIMPVLQKADAIQIMGVTPGAQGQSLIPGTIEKIHQLRRRWPDLVIAVDGGLNAKTIGSAAASGADRLIVGSAITASADYAAALAELKKQVTIALEE